MFVVFYILFLFLRKYEKKKVRNMLLLMLDPRFKNLHLMSSFIGLNSARPLLKNMIKNFVSHTIKMLSLFALIV